MTYRAGQVRYTGGTDYTEQIQALVSYKSTVTSQSTEDEQNSTSFQDILITPSTGAFESNTDYYLHIAIPQDMNYLMTFNIKLVRGQDTMSQTFQFIKQIVVERGGLGGYDHDVALYELVNDADEFNGEVKAMIPHVYDPTVTSVRNELYYTKNMDSTGTYNGTNTYYIGLGGRGANAYLPTTHVNLITMIESWRGATDQYAIFDMVFRPIEDGFSGILLEMLRTTEDYSIQAMKTLDDGSSIVQYGRLVDKDKMTTTTQLYRLKDQVERIHKGGSLTRIGVWSHPDLLMAVNGEEIRVGPSGYYEDDIVPVTSLGIVAPPNNYGNTFTLDYTFDEDEDTSGGES